CRASRSWGRPASRGAAPPAFHQPDWSAPAASSQESPRTRSRAEAPGPWLRHHRRRRLIHVRLRHADGQLSYAEDVRGPLGDADAVARVKDVEEVRALER